MRRTEGVTRRKGVSLAKGPVGIIGAILLAGGVLGLLFGGTGLVLLLSAPMHWSAKTMAMLGGVVMAIACALAIVDGDVLGIFAANSWTMLAFGAAAVALGAVAAPTAVRLTAGVRRARAR